MLHFSLRLTFLDLLLFLKSLPVPICCLLGFLPSKTLHKSKINQKSTVKDKDGLVANVSVIKKMAYFLVTRQIDLGTLH